MSKEKPLSQNVGKEGVSRLENDHSISFARAMAIRTVMEQERTQRLVTEFQGEQYQPLHPVLREGLIRTATQWNEMILTNPAGLPRDLNTLIVTVFDDIDDSVFDEILHEEDTDGEEPLAITVQQLRSFAVSTIENFAKPFMPQGDPATSEKPFNGLLEQFNEAKNIGTEKNIDPSMVYLDDDLYSELMRRMTNPNRAAEIGIESAQRITAEKMKEILINQMVLVEQAACQAEGIPPMEQDEIEETRQIYANDPEIIREADEAALQIRGAMKFAIVDNIVRFWGEEGLNSLPPAVKTNLTDYQSSTS